MRASDGTSIHSLCSLGQLLITTLKADSLRWMLVTQIVVMVTAGPAIISEGNENK